MLDTNSQYVSKTDFYEMVKEASSVTSLESSSDLLMLIERMKKNIYARNSIGAVFEIDLLYATDPKLTPDQTPLFIAYPSVAGSWLVSYIGYCMAEIDGSPSKSDAILNEKNRSAELAERINPSSSGNLPFGGKLPNNRQNSFRQRSGKITINELVV